MLERQSSSLVPIPSAQQEAPKFAASPAGETAKRIEEIIARYPKLVTGVSVVDLKSGEITDFGVKAPFEASSITQLLTASLFLKTVETGSASLDESLGGTSAEKQIKSMLEKNERSAWQALNERLGRGNLQSHAHGIGLKSFNSSDNTISPNDMAIYLKKLHGKEILSPGNTSLLLSYLQNTGDEQYIKSSIPSSAKTYHKTGIAKDRVLDVAIIDDGSHPYGLVIFVKAREEDHTPQPDIFQEITKATHGTIMTR